MSFNLGEYYMNKKFGSQEFNTQKLPAYLWVIIIIATIMGLYTVYISTSYLISIVGLGSQPPSGIAIVDLITGLGIVASVIGVWQGQNWGRWLLLILLAIQASLGVYQIITEFILFGSFGQNGLNFSVLRLAPLLVYFWSFSKLETNAFFTAPKSPSARFIGSYIGKGGPLYLIGGIVAIVCSVWVRENGGFVDLVNVRTGTVTTAESQEFWWATGFLVFGVVSIIGGLGVASRSAGKNSKIEG
jgi:hypothetical protein